MRVPVIGLAFVLAACGSRGFAPPTYDLDRVRATFADECRDPLGVDEEVCDQVVVEEIGGYEGTVQVPTTLEPSAAARAAAVCEWVALLGVDAGADGLGYRTVVILDMSGGEIADCSAG